MRKLIALLLCSIMLFENTVWAAEPVDSTEITDQTDIYAMEYSEELSIDGSTYTYNYSYNNQGNRTIEIIDNLTKETDIVEYDSKTDSIFLNGECVSLTGTQDEQLDLDFDLNNIEPNAAPKYTYLGSKTKKISWGKGIAAASLAAIIATAIGSVSAAAVIAKISLSSLSVIAAASVNAVVKTKIYSRKSGKITNYKYVWSFTPSGGSKYGDFTTYVTVD